MQTCGSCGTTLLSGAEHVEAAGEAGVMMDAPLPFQLGERVRIAKANWDVQGHVRYNYGRGWWDEFWLTSSKGRSCWLSVDEGDLVQQRKLPQSKWPSLTRPPALGATIAIVDQWQINYDVTEVGSGTCIAFRGAFPEVIGLGDHFTYINAIGDGGGLLSGEFWETEQAWFTGSYIDPFTIKRPK